MSMRKRVRQFIGGTPTAWRKRIANTVRDIAATGQVFDRTDPRVVATMAQPLKDVEVAGATARLREGVSAQKVVVTL